MLFGRRYQFGRRAVTIEPPPHAFVFAGRGLAVMVAPRPGGSALVRRRKALQRNVWFRRQ